MNELVYKLAGKWGKLNDRSIDSEIDLVIDVYLSVFIPVLCSQVLS